MEKLRVGYSFWGFMSDYKLDVTGKTLSTPDGNATYSWSLLYEMQFRGHDVWGMQENRDWPAYQIHGRKAFSAFSERKRYDAFKSFPSVAYEKWPDNNLPPLDVLLLEWRWPIIGRNMGISLYHPDYQPDWHRQHKLLAHYKNTDTKIIVWDLDHKLTKEDEKFWLPDAIFETSVEPRRQHLQRTRVEPPILTEELDQFPMLEADPCRKLVYIGSRYERDDVIEQYVKPVSERFPKQVEFWGNWRRPDNLIECLEKWPDIAYYDRITTKDFRKVYGTAGACPLLAKRDYLQTGFITPRVWEALMFGTIPIGLAEMTGIEQYVSLVARDADELGNIADWLCSLSARDRELYRQDNIRKIRFMDASNFVDKIEDVVNGNIRRETVTKISGN